MTNPATTRTVLNSMFEELRARAPAALYWLIEDADPLACELHLLQEMLASAEDPYTRGLVSGIYLARLAQEQRSLPVGVAAA